MKYMLAGLVLLIGIAAQGQARHGKPKGGDQHIDQNFCNTLMGLVYDVADSFKDVRGKKTHQSVDPCYECTHKVAGVAQSWIRRSGGEWVYQGMIHSDTSVSVTRGFYEEYAAHMRSCLPNAGYKLEAKPDAHNSLPEFPDLVYRHSTASVSIGLKVSHTSSTGMYVVQVFMTR